MSQSCNQPCDSDGGSVFVCAHMVKPSPTELLQAVAEPTRLRILNCLAAAPLFVADLQEVLALPQPTVSRHLQILRKADLVRDTPIAPVRAVPAEAERGRSAGPDAGLDPLRAGGAGTDPQRAVPGARAEPGRVHDTRE